MLPYNRANQSLVAPNSLCLTLYTPKRPRQEGTRLRKQTRERPCGAGPFCFGPCWYLTLPPHTPASLGINKTGKHLFLLHTGSNSSHMTLHARYCHTLATKSLLKSSWMHVFKGSVCGTRAFHLAQALRDLCLPGRHVGVPMRSRCL